MKRIGIIGIGGIGGFIGAPLVNYYSQTDGVEIVFICRGETLKSISSRGLILKAAEKEIVAHPVLVSDDAKHIGKLDAVFITTKPCSHLRMPRPYKSINVSITPKL
ncbi:2-dehydropantoate 2-reductase N-terminal domain-containing protein [Telluribacter humicola]|uniref:2-dehydropantoate 2-reductase N-terminal domain-containing protein n=1 Tax=Telluribacter humicola TaxID=1720261 RepID=UPI001A9584BB|nr:2-dehydropantoate 2-reductase N-terminal domain-containing protein [Telluribacter humicola]